MKDFLNPLSMFSQEQYDQIWQVSLYLVFHGIFAYLLAILFSGLSLYFWIRRKQAAAGAVFLLLSMVVAYGSTLYSLFGGKA